MSQDIILKVQGKASSSVEEEFKKKSKIKKENIVTLFISSSEFNVANNVVLEVYDFLQKKTLGKLVLLEVYLPFNRLGESIEKGHRTLALFEVIEGSMISITNEMEEFNRFDIVENRFFLHNGRFDELYNKYYKKG